MDGDGIQATSISAVCDRFIVRNPIAAILLDMGMGKTSLALMAINKLMYEEFEVGKVLIIAPLRVAKNTWPADHFGK